VIASGEQGPGSSAVDAVLGVGVTVTVRPLSRQLAARLASTAGWSAASVSVTIAPSFAASNPGSQGLTLVHFSVKLEPFLTHKNNLHTINTPKHPLNTGYTIITRTPYPIKSARVELRSERV
jgi:hypothetical protein